MGKLQCVRFVFNYIDEDKMMKFVNKYWDRISNVYWSDDFDGEKWIVLLLPENDENKK